MSQAQQEPAADGLRLGDQREVVHGDARPAQLSDCLVEVCGVHDRHRHEEQSRVVLQDVFDGGDREAPPHAQVLEIQGASARRDRLAQHPPDGFGIQGHCVGQDRRQLPRHRRLAGAEGSVQPDYLSLRLCRAGHRRYGIGPWQLRITV